MKLKQIKANLDLIREQLDAADSYMERGVYNDARQSIIEIHFLAGQTNRALIAFILNRKD